MRARLVAIIALTICLGPAAQAAPIKLGKYAKSFKGEGGILVATARAGESQILLKITGLEGKVDGMVFLAEEQNASRGAKTYVVQLNGRGWHILRKEPNRWGGGDTYRLHVPGRKGLEVYYDEKGSKKVKAQKLLALHKKQAKELAKLALFDRKGEEKRAEADLAESLKAANKACGGALKVKITWSTVTDETFKKYSISGYCGNQLDGLRRGCSDAKFKAAAAKLKTATCAFGDKHKIKVKGDAVTFNIDFNKGNQADVAKAVLENALTD